MKKTRKSSAGPSGRCGTSLLLPACGCDLNVSQFLERKSGLISGFLEPSLSSLLFSTVFGKVEHGYARNVVGLAGRLPGSAVFSPVHCRPGLRGVARLVSLQGPRAPRVAGFGCVRFVVVVCLLLLRKGVRKPHCAPESHSWLGGLCWKVQGSEVALRRVCVEGPWGGG